jgi:predicted dehydrogenase
MATNEPLRIAQIGVGGFGAFRRAVMRKTGLFSVVAAYDRNAQALAQCGHEENCHAASSYEDMLAVPGLQAVIICSGATAHAQQVIAALSRGLHVFVEKPVCCRPEEAEAMVAAQRQYGGVVMVGHHHHVSDPASQAIKRLIDGGDLGQVVAVEATTAHGGGFHIEAGDWRGDAGNNPGGMLFQCGVHVFHELSFYFGRIEAVACLMRNDVHPRTATADSAQCLLRFASGVTATVSAYHVTPYRHTLSIFGTAANLHRDNRAFTEGIRCVVQHRRDNLYEPQVPLHVDERYDHAHEMVAFHAAITQGGVVYPSLLDGIHALNVVFAAARSADRDGAFQAVPYYAEGVAVPALSH